MLKTAGLILCAVGFLLHFVPRLAGLRAALKPEKLEKEAGDDPTATP